jgi:hypothetical protein
VIVVAPEVVDLTRLARSKAKVRVPAAVWLPFPS